MTTYYKATHLDGKSWQQNAAGERIDYAAALASGEVIRHPAKRRVRNDASTYLSVSVAAADCTGAEWPCRLFRVEPVGRVMGSDDFPNKRAVSALRVVEELPAHLALGPNGEQVAAFIEACKALTVDDWRKIASAWDAARDAAWDAALDAARDAAWVAARVAAWDAARVAARDAARDAALDAALAAAWTAARDAARVAALDAALAAAWTAAWDAARAIVTRDIITDEQYDILTQPFVDAGFARIVGREGNP